jgi:hypothetical protein
MTNLPQNNTILDAGNLAEMLGDDGEYSETSDLTSTHEPEAAGMSFHVQMNGYTLGNFEEMVIRTAADLLLNSGASDDRLKKLVEERAISLISAKADAHLDLVSTQVMNQPMMSGGKDALTVAEYIGLVGRDYLTTPVDRDGNPSKSFYDKGVPRIERVVATVMDKKFKDEIAAGLSALTKELKAMAAVKLDALIVEERERVATALGFEIKRTR